MGSDVTLLAAFIGGLLTFFSPCMLPVLPGYLSFVAGVTEGRKEKLKIFLHTLFFVLGFSTIFVVLGIFLSAISSVFADFQTWLNRIGGILIIIFGIFMLGLIEIPFLKQEHRVETQFKRKTLLTSFLMGAAFAVGWSPCVSAILGSILIVATVTQGKGAILLTAFSLGLGLPFLITSLFLDQVRKFIQISGRFLKYLNILAGILLIALGIFIFTGKFVILLNIIA